MSILLTRDEFRKAVFLRDGHKCVVCKAPAQDAHHIIERRLWPDGGYYLDNGASLCGKHHMDAEETTLSVEKIRELCGIKKTLVPPHMYRDTVYDKWGNTVLPNGQRTKGELFADESVQKVLKKHIHLFTDYVKYPRTYHVFGSPGLGEDDRIMSDMRPFLEKNVVITEKMDGENTTMYQDHIHARSVDSAGHPSRDWVANYWAKIKYEIPKGWRICGENMYAEHSIRYNNLESYFLGFSVWNEHNICLSWNDTVEWFQLLGIVSVPVLFRGPYFPGVIRIFAESINTKRSEGFVIRVADAFPYSDFRQNVAKWVRAGHVQTTKHWMRGQQVKPNGLR